MRGSLQLLPRLDQNVIDTVSDCGALIFLWGNKACRVYQNVATECEVKLSPAADEEL